MSEALMIALGLIIASVVTPFVLFGLWATALIILWLIKEFFRHFWWYTSRQPGSVSEGDMVYTHDGREWTVRSVKGEFVRAEHEEGMFSFTESFFLKDIRKVG